jgi:hypothetical protein
MCYFSGRINWVRQNIVTQQNYIRDRNSQINYYKRVALFYQTGTDFFGLYKPAGTSLSEMRLSQQRHPPLYIQEADRITAIKENQKSGFECAAARCWKNRDPIINSESPAQTQ